jgi:hypothetical protein
VLKKYEDEKPVKMRREYYKTEKLVKMSRVNEKL